jgi:hypothetical protein
LVESLSREAERKARDFNPQEIANTLWALATAGVRLPGSLVESLSREAERKARDFNPQDIANMLWALATAGGRLLGSLVSLSREAERKVRDFKPRGIAITLWAIAVLELFDDFFSFITTSGCALFDNPTEVEWDEPGLTQLHQFFLAAKLHCSRGAIPRVGRVGGGPSMSGFMELSLGFAQRCRQRFVEISKKGARTSQLQRSLAELVRETVGDSVRVLEEQVLEQDGGGYSVDILITSSSSPCEKRDEVKVVVEVDGPSHFLVDHGDADCHVMNGSSCLKQRLLTSSGWLVVRVPYYEWDSLQDKRAKSLYLRGILPASLTDRRTSHLSRGMCA